MSFLSFLKSLNPWSSIKNVLLLSEDSKMLNMLENLYGEKSITASVSKRLILHPFKDRKKVRQLLKIEQKERETIEVGRKELSANKKKLPPEWIMGNKILEGLSREYFKDIKGNVLFKANKKDEIFKVIFYLDEESLGRRYSIKNVIRNFKEYSRSYPKITFKLDWEGEKRDGYYSAGIRQYKNGKKIIGFEYDEQKIVKEILKNMHYYLENHVVDIEERKKIKPILNMFFSMIKYNPDRLVFLDYLYTAITEPHHMDAEYVASAKKARKKIKGEIC